MFAVQEVAQLAKRLHWVVHLQHLMNSAPGLRLLAADVLHVLVMKVALPPSS